MPRKGCRTNISNIVGALFPICFVLALGYLAGKRNTFDAKQARGLIAMIFGFDASPSSWREVVFDKDSPGEAMRYIVTS
jgi:hypothetical protein